MHELAVGTPYASYGDVITLVVWFLFDAFCAYPTASCLYSLAARDGYCMRLGTQLFVGFFVGIDTLALFFSFYAGNGEAQLWQAMVWVSIAARLCVIVAPSAIREGYLGWGIGVMWFTFMALIASNVMMWVAVDYWSNPGPWFGLVTVVIYFFQLLIGILTFCSCGRCCGYNGYVTRAQDVAAHSNPTGAHTAKQMQKQNQQPLKPTTTTIRGPRVSASTGFQFPAGRTSRHYSDDDQDEDE